jgi:hypothetical protein
MVLVGSSRYARPQLLALLVEVGLYEVWSTKGSGRGHYGWPGALDLDSFGLNLAILANCGPNL